MQNAYFPYLTKADRTSSCHDMTGCCVKRLLDIVVSAVAILCLWPLALVIAMAIRLTSPGPIFFRQKRIGFQGREFTILKFRSMIAGNDDRRHRSLMRNVISGAHATQDKVVKLKDDRRITPIGRLLRRTCFDEIPQFVNVLKGEMSLVGPRPAISYEYELHETWHRLRTRAIPGMTGLWQVSKRENLNFNNMVALDLTYIRQQCFTLDLKLLLLTPLAIFVGNGMR